MVQWIKQTLDIAASAMENQKAAIVETQQRLRDEYKKHLSLNKQVSTILALISSIKRYKIHCSEKKI